MAPTGNNHNSSNQPRRKRNKKPVKRYSEEYSNRPNPYTGYSADGNYHPEAMKRTGSGTHTERSRSAEEARQASVNAALAEAAWGPAKSAAPAPAPAIPSVQAPTQTPAQAQPQQPPYVPPTVTVPPPKWAVSNNLTRQQMAAQETTHTAPIHFEPEEVKPSGGRLPAEAEAAPQVVSADPQANPQKGVHRRRNHRTKEENARERAAKTEAKRAAVEKIAQGVAAHSVSEQMINDIASMSDVIGSIPKQPQKAAVETGVNWEEFYDAAFPSRIEDNSRFAAKKNKQPKKRVDFKEDASADAPMIVKPVVLGDDDLLPYDKIAKENAREKAESLSLPKIEEKADKKSETKSFTEEQPAEKTAYESDPYEIMFPELDIPEPSDTAENELEDISDVVGVISIEEILASVEKQKQAGAVSTEAVKTDTEFSLNTEFSFDSEADESWNEAIPSRSEAPSEEEKPSHDSADEVESAPLPSEETAEPPVEYTEEAFIDAVDLSQFLNVPKDASDEEISEPVTEAEPSEIDVAPEPSEAFAPEVIIDSAALENTEQTDFFPQPSEETTAEPTVTDQTPPVAAEVAVNPAVDVIIADFEDDIFAEETIASPGSLPKDDADEGIDIEDKIEKLAEAAEIAEVFRIESEDLLLDNEAESDNTDIFSVNIDDIAVSPEIRTAEDEEIKQYQPREKKRDSSENVFESVLIVDDNPQIIDPAASAGQDETMFLHYREQSENPTAVFKLPDGPIVFPTDIDDAEFQEQWLDEEEDGDDMASRNKRTRRRISAFLGAIALLFAVMILFSAVRTVVSGFTSIGSTSEKKTEYTEFISPVVVNDPMPFETLDKADNNMLLKSSIWQALKELDETEGYEHVSDATNKIVLPADKVEKAAKELFGKNVKLNMNVLSEYDGSAIYYYDSIDDSFHITRSGITGPSPVISKIAQKSDHVSLVVGYLSQEEMFLTSSETSEEECYKFMEYVLGLNSDGSYYIKSIRNYVED